MAIIIKTNLPVDTANDDKIFSVLYSLSKLYAGLHFNVENSCYVIAIDNDDEQYDITVVNDCINNALAAVSEGAVVVSSERCVNFSQRYKSFLSLLALRLDSRAKYYQGPLVPRVMERAKNIHSRYEAYLSNFKILDPETPPHLVAFKLQQAKCFLDKRAGIEAEQTYLNLWNFMESGSLTFNDKECCSGPMFNPTANLSTVATEVSDADGESTVTVCFKRTKMPVSSVVTELENNENLWVEVNLVVAQLGKQMRLVNLGAGVDPKKRDGFTIALNRFGVATDLYPYFIKDMQNCLYSAGLSGSYEISSVSFLTNCKKEELDAITYNFYQTLQPLETSFWQWKPEANKKHKNYHVFPRDKSDEAKTLQALLNGRGFFTKIKEQPTGLVLKVDFAKTLLHK